MATTEAPPADTPSVQKLTAQELHTRGIRGGELEPHWTANTIIRETSADETILYIERGLSYTRASHRNDHV